ncbi:hypothetical protein KKB18_03315 [bacterium]|nr:hypothetical protein [bacterium]
MKGFSSGKLDVKCEMKKSLIQVELEYVSAVLKKKVAKMFDVDPRLRKIMEYLYRFTYKNELDLLNTEMRVA